MKKILIVDDEKNIRITLKHGLSQNYELDMAINGDEAIEKLKTNKYDLMLLDINMPGKDGMEVLRIIHSMDIKISIIMMTAYGTIERAVEAMKLGAVDFINKPFTPNEIETAIQTVIYRKDLKEDSLESYHDMINFIKLNMIDGNYAKALEFSKQTLGKYPDMPEPHNLIGILYEYENNISSAQKHYRAALALDPTYQPAQNNLERTATRRFYTPVDIGVDEDEKK